MENSQEKDIKKETSDKKKISFLQSIASFINTSLSSLFKGYMTPFKNTYYSRVKNLELAIKVLLMVVVFFMFLTYGLVRSTIDASKDKTIKIKVPDFIETGANYIVNKDTASGTYFELIAKGFVTTAANYNYMNIEKKINSLLPSVLPYTYSSTFSTIKKNVQFVVNEKVNQKFTIQKVETLVKGSRAKVTFTGLLTRTVGSIKVIDKRPYKIPVILRIVDYTPYIESFDFDYIGISKAEKDKDIALKRSEEIEAEKKKELERKKNRESSYKQRQKAKKSKEEF